MGQNSCAVDVCDRQSVSRGLCGAHYWRWQHGADLSTPVNDWTPTPMECSVPGCTKRTRTTAAVLCDMHYMRRRRHGDLNKGVASTGTRRVRADGYIEIKLSDGRWVLEHRAVVEQTIGRVLESWEQVHHIDGSRDNNAPENLQVLTNAEHQRLHQHPHMYRRSRVQLTCQLCGRGYEVKASKAKESKYCKNECRMQAMWDARRVKAAERRNASSRT